MEASAVTEMKNLSESTLTRKAFAQLEAVFVCYPVLEGGELEMVILEDVDAFVEARKAGVPEYEVDTAWEEFLALLADRGFEFAI